jgi:hypothetical protein
VALGRLIKGTYRIAAQKTYRERVLASTGRDPLRCARCGREMLLWQVWHPRSLFRAFGESELDRPTGTIS